jgi:hypothetical protein
MKIQLKRSNVLLSGTAKKPSSDQMEYGELAVNYNQTDPAIFIKDSDNNIIRIAGGDSIGNEGYPDIGDGLGETLDKRYVNVTGDTMTGALNVPAGASGTEVPQIQEVVKKTGDTMTGNLDVVGAKVTSDSTLDSDSGTTLVTKDYVDNSTIGYPDTDDGDGTTLDARYVKVVGDTMTGNLALPGGGGDTEALQKQEIETLIEELIDASDTGAGKYVEIAGDTMTGNLTLPGGGGDTDALQKQEIEELIEIEIDAIDFSSVSSGPTFPPTGIENELFFNTTDGRLYIYYNDGSSSQWIDASPDSPTSVVTSSPSPPANPKTNDLWFDEDSGKTFIYHTDSDSSQWVETNPTYTGPEGSVAGFRNLIINGAVTINQREKTYAEVANDEYWADRWKKVSGGMTQIIEDGNYEPNSTYTLSGLGVTTQQVTSPGVGHWTIPTIPSTATKIQLEIGTVATPFERRPVGIEWQLCLRYYWETLGDGANYRAYAYNQRQANDNTSNATKSIIINFPVKMRVPPSGSTINLGTFDFISTYACNYTDTTESFNSVNASLRDGKFDAEL